MTSWNFSSNFEAPMIGVNQMLPQGLWNDPCVHQLNDFTFVMYLTTSTVEPFKPPVLPFRAISQNGSSWELSPAVPLLNTTGTPYESIETPSVVYFKGMWHMYYTGVYPANTSPYPMAIGHAISPNGISWSHVNNGNPVLYADGKILSWKSYLVAEPGAIVIDDEIFVFFSAVSARLNRKINEAPQKQSIGLGISQNGQDFLEVRLALEQEFPFNAESGFAGYSTPCAVFYRNQILLFHDVAYYNETEDPSWRQVYLSYATSEDGISFTQYPYGIGDCYSCFWTNVEIRSPSVLVIEDSLHMWYAGNADILPILKELQHTDVVGTSFGIGYSFPNI